jgi:hypothetical protein
MTTNSDQSYRSGSRFNVPVRSRAGDTESGGDLGNGDIGHFGVTTPNVNNRRLRNSNYRIEAQKVRSFLGGENVLPRSNRGVSQVHGDQVLRNTVLSGGASDELEGCLIVLQVRIQEFQ